MAKRKKEDRVGICTYCCAEGPVNEDHVPPQTLFPSGTFGLIAVDSCWDCNVGASKDDEFFVHMVSLSHDPTEFPGDPTLDRVRRKVESGRPGLVLKTRRDQVRVVRIEPPEGARDAHIVVSTEDDIKRMRRVLSRYARGIFFHETKRRLPLSARISVEKFMDVRTLSAERHKRGLGGLGRVFDLLDTLPERVIGRRVFTYRLAEDGGLGATFYFCFFDRIEFLVTLDGESATSGTKGRVDS